MSCPDWKGLAAHRLEKRGTEPAGWPEALEHFDGCALCRKEALKADPTLVFRRMATVAPVTDRSEIEAVRQGVMALRGASRLEGPSRKLAWRRWAAAAVLAVAALSVERDKNLESLRADVVSDLTPPTLGSEAAPEWPELEELSPPAERVYQAGNTVMVYDERFGDV